jgi:hypothetical protein
VRFRDIAGAHVPLDDASRGDDRQERIGSRQGHLPLRVHD